MVAHQFPPSGGSGVQRTVKFVKYLRGHGWEPTVFTRSDRGLALRDESMLAEVPDGVEVIRSKAWCFSELKGPLSYPGRFVARKALIPDGERAWQRMGRKAALKAASRVRPDVLYTTSYPYSDHLMGLYLKGRLGSLPWVADFRDEWTMNPNIADYGYGKRRRRKEKAMEESVFRRADRIIANTPYMKDNFLSMYPFAEGKVRSIPNGYDEEDFAGLGGPRERGARFTVTFTGLLYGRRRPDPFFEALSGLVANGSVNPGKVTVRMIGSFKGRQVESLAEAHGLGGVVEVMPYLPHRQSVESLVTSDCLLLVAGAGEEAFHLGKVFEYMRSGRPILAVVPGRGAAADLIRETATGTVADCSDIGMIRTAFKALYDAWEDGAPSHSPNWDEVRRYERREIARMLSEVLTEAADG